MAAPAATAVPFGATWLWPEAGAEGGTDAARSTDPGGAGGVGPPTEIATGREWPLQVMPPATAATSRLAISTAAPGRERPGASLPGPQLPQSSPHTHEQPYAGAIK